MRTLTLHWFVLVLGQALVFCDLICLDVQFFKVVKI